MRAKVDPGDVCRQLRGLAGSRPACPRVNVGPVVWETFYSLAFATKDFNPYVVESKFIVALYFMKVAFPFLLRPYSKIYTFSILSIAEASSRMKHRDSNKPIRFRWIQSVRNQSCNLRGLKQWCCIAAGQRRLSIDVYLCYQICSIYSMLKIQAQGHKC